MDQEKLLQYLRGLDAPASIREIQENGPCAGASHAEMAAALQDLARQNRAFRSLQNGQAYYGANPEQGEGASGIQDMIHTLHAALGQKSGGELPPESPVHWSFKQGLRAKTSDYEIPLPDGYVSFPDGNREFVAVASQYRNDSDSAPVALYDGEALDFAAPDSFQEPLVRDYVVCNTTRKVFEQNAALAPLMKNLECSRFFETGDHVAYGMALRTGPGVSYQFILSGPRRAKMLRVQTKRTPASALNAEFDALVRWIGGLRWKDTFVRTPLQSQKGLKDDGAWQQAALNVANDAFVYLEMLTVLYVGEDATRDVAEAQLKRARVLIDQYMREVDGAIRATPGLSEETLMKVRLGFEELLEYTIRAGGQDVSLPVNAGQQALLDSWKAAEKKAAAAPVDKQKLSAEAESFLRTMQQRLREVSQRWKDFCNKDLQGFSTRLQLIYGLQGEAAAQQFASQIQSATYDTYAAIDAQLTDGASEIDQKLERLQKVVLPGNIFSRLVNHLDEWIKEYKATRKVSVGPLNLNGKESEEITRLSGKWRAAAKEMQRRQDAEKYGVALEDLDRHRKYLAAKDARAHATTSEAARKAERDLRSLGGYLDSEALAQECVNAAAKLQEKEREAARIAEEQKKQEALKRQRRIEAEEQSREQIEDENRQKYDDFIQSVRDRKASQERTIGELRDRVSAKRRELEGLGLLKFSAKKAARAEIENLCGQLEKMPDAHKEEILDTWRDASVDTRDAVVDCLVFNYLKACDGGKSAQDVLRSALTETEYTQFDLSQASASLKRLADAGMLLRTVSDNSELYRALRQGEDLAALRAEEDRKERKRQEEAKKKEAEQAKIRAETEQLKFDLELEIHRCRRVSMKELQKKFPQYSYPRISSAMRLLCMENRSINREYVNGETYYFLDY